MKKILLINPKLKETFGINGYRKVKNKYSWESLAEKTEDAYIKIIN